MLKLVGNFNNTSATDEYVLLDDANRPTKFLLGLAILELALDITLAIVLANTIFRRS